MSRDELRRRINDDIIEYLNEPYNNGTDEQLRDAIETIYEIAKENIEWYMEDEHYNKKAELKLEWR